MLPPTFFDRLTKALGVRIGERREEKRKSVRIPSCIPATFCALDGPIIGPPVNVRLRDISSTGIGLLAANHLPAPKLLLIKLSPKNVDPDVLLCMIRRIVQLDNVCQLWGCSFEKILFPGQNIENEASVLNLLWVDVSGDHTPEDPRAQKITHTKNPSKVRPSRSR